MSAPRTCGYCNDKLPTPEQLGQAMRDLHALALAEGKARGIALPELSAYAANYGFSYLEMSLAPQVEGFCGSACKGGFQKWGNLRAGGKR